MKLIFPLQLIFLPTAPLVFLSLSQTYALFLSDWKTSKVWGGSLTGNPSKT